MPNGDTVPHLKYPWQQFLLEALMELNPDQLPAKIAKARRVISARLYGIGPDDIGEHIALSEAIVSLRIKEVQVTSSGGNPNQGELPS